MRNNSKMTESSIPTIDRQKQFWDWHWQNWRERKTINSWKERRHELLLSALRSLQLDRPHILDLGCGQGWFAAKLAMFGDTTGIDLSEEGIRDARRRDPHVKFIAGNLYTYPLPFEYYDVIVSQEVVDHVQDQVAFIHRAADVLKPGGYFILSCANKFVIDRVGPDEFPKQPPDHIADYLSLSDLKRLLSARFRVIHARSILPVAGSRGILRLVNSFKVNAALGTFLSPHQVDALKEFAGFGYQLVALAQKKS